MPSAAESREAKRSRKSQKKRTFKNDFDMKYALQPYRPELARLWDETVEKVRQRSFLFLRRYMDYHSNRFRDRSLMVADAGGQMVALLPACEHPKEARLVVSHAGLTYGGLLLTPQCRTADALEILSACRDHYAALGYTEWVCKPVPHIYHCYPAEEELYALFRLGARLTARGVSTAIRLADAYPFSTLRQRKVKKAQRLPGLRLAEGADRLADFWKLLRDVLQQRHGCDPVHSLPEMQLLADRFPQQIRLFAALWPQAEGGETLLAGCWVFLCQRVAHVQYIAASETACQNGVLDWLFAQLIAWLPTHCPAVEYLDFGISTEQDGKWLNEGLIFQKEGFGGRAVCYDQYALRLTPPSAQPQ